MLRRLTEAVRTCKGLQSNKHSHLERTVDYFVRGLFKIGILDCIGTEKEVFLLKLVKIQSNRMVNYFKLV